MEKIMGPIRSGATLAAALLTLVACNKPTEQAAANGAAAEQPAAPVVAGPVPQPVLKAGFWENSMTSSMMGGVTNVMRICYDEAMAREAALTGRRGPGSGDADNCQQSFNRQLDGSYKVASVCETPRGKTTTEGVIRGDFANAYTAEMIMKMEGGPPEMAEGMKTSLSAKRLGDCPADFAAGDVEINGVKMDMAARMAGRGGPGGRGPGGPPGGPPPAR
jgi:hypothetical protein